MNIEAVTVCIGYADFLEESARFNDGVIDHWVVVTVDKDEATREVCRKNSIECLLSGDYCANGEPFNKGRLIERGLQHLSTEGWRVHLDADIVLPLGLRNIVAAADLDAHKLYGADRVMVRSYCDWQKLQRLRWLTHSHHCLVRPPDGFEIGTRWCHHESGYVPIGFFQMWNAKQDLWRGARSRSYPTRHNDACRTDVQFGLKWDRRHRELLPEFFVVHLESEKTKNGANWCGRTTKPFKPEKCYGG